MYGSFWSLIPFFVVVPIALWTKQVIPGLAVGLFIGAYLVHPSPMGGFQSALTYTIKEATTKGNMNLIIFLYGFGAFVGLIRVTGGVAGFSNWIGNKIKSIRGAFALTWLSSLFTFMAPDFRIITIAPVVKRIFERLGVSPERVAYAIDVTATPLTAIVPLGTAFVGYMIGLMHTSVDHAAPSMTPYQLFIASIPFNLFAWVMLILGFVLTFFHHSKEPAAADVQSKKRDSVMVKNPAALPDTRNGRLIGMKSRQVAHQLSMEAGVVGGTLTGTRGGFVNQGQGKAWENARSATRSKDKDEEIPDPVETMSHRVTPSLANLVVPLAFLLLATVVLTYISGYQQGGRGLFQTLIQANASAAMLQALILTLVFMFAFYAFRKQPIERTMFGLLHGGNEMMPVIVLLVLIWAVSAVASDLGFSQFCQREITAYVPHTLIVPALFVFGCVISYFIGSSFGTWAMLMPLGFSLAQTGAAGLPVIAGAVFASGTFGGFASPLSDNTVAMATMMKLPVMQYANYKTKSASVAAGICVVLYLVLEWVRL